MITIHFDFEVNLTWTQLDRLSQETLSLPDIVLVGSNDGYTIRSGNLMQLILFLMRIAYLGADGLLPRYDITKAEMENANESK